MRNCIKASNALSEQLADAHYTDTTIEISPEMQLIIYRHWGPPHIILSVKVQRVALRKDPMALQRLKEAAEKAKIELYIFKYIIYLLSFIMYSTLRSAFFPTER